MPDPIPLVDLRAQYEPLKDEIRQAWDEVLESMQLFLGPNVQALEREFAAYCGVAHAVGISDGTTALHLALRAGGIGPGDEVITVSHTFIATAEAILLAGATPVLVDVDPGTYNMDVNQVEAAITARTRAILPVHLYGQCADMDPILDMADRHGLSVIEDACQAHGAEYRGRRAGSLGTLAAFSFYYSKNLGAFGEAGMVTTNDDELARRVRLLRDHGSEQRYHHDVIGLNGRLDELQAAALRIKLRHLDEWNERRRQHAARYQQALAGLDVVTPVEALYGRHVYHLYVIRTCQRDALQEWLAGQGIGTGVHYPIPVHLQRACAELERSPGARPGAASGRELPAYGPGSLPVTESLVGEILSLPMYPELRASQIEQVAAGIRSFFAAGGQGAGAGGRQVR
jgi:dTDP-4-amino-4,6-dideoxygalactose transaminase